MWVVCHLSRCPFVYNRLRGGCNVKMSHTRLLWPRENRGFSRWNLRWVLCRLWNWTFAVKPHLCDGSPFLRRFCTGWPMLSDELDSKPEVIFTTSSAASLSLYIFIFSDGTCTDTHALLFCSSSQLLVQFVQNASIPLVQGLEDSDSKHSCLPLLAPAESSLCSPLELTGLPLTSTIKPETKTIITVVVLALVHGTHSHVTLL